MGRAGADQYHKEVEGSGKGRGCTKPVIPVMSTVGIFDGDDRDQVCKTKVRSGECKGDPDGKTWRESNALCSASSCGGEVEVERLSKGKMENGGSGGETFVNILVE